MVRDITKKAVLFYIAGYIARKVGERACTGCQELLKGRKTGATHEVFVTNKQYENLRGDGLVCPSQNLFLVAQQLDASYTSKIEHVMYGKKVMATLVLELNKDLGRTSLCCPRPDGCPLQSLVTVLFVKISLFSSLKDNSRQFSCKSQK